jgi:hypothetical protein
MNIFADFDARITRVVQDLGLTDKAGAPLDLSRITVEPPRDASHGDLATNAAMVLAKPAGQNPRALAETLATALRADPDIVTVDVAGPGFVNMKVSDAFWQKHLAAVLAAGTGYGRSIGAGIKINVEYVSANPTGPMHVGHCRGAVVGDALANLLAFAGYDGDQGIRTSTTRDRRSTFSAVRPSCATARRLATTSARFRRASIPATTSSRSARRWPTISAASCCRCPRTRRLPSSRTARSTP